MLWLSIILLCAALPAEMAGSAEKNAGNRETYRSEKFGYELSYPAELEYKAYFEGSSGDLRDRNSGSVLVYFEVWPPDECPRDTPDTNARSIGIERAKAITQADGPGGSSYCGDPMSVREYASLHGVPVYELELTCMSETFPVPHVDGEEDEPDMEETNDAPVVRHEGKKGPTYFMDISQPWRKRILLANPVGSNPLKPETKIRPDPAGLRKILETLKTFQVGRPEGICIEDLRNRNPAIRIAPSPRKK